jgi:hypothetical protein
MSPHAKTPIGIKEKWEKSDGDTSICHLCKEPIFGTMFTLWVGINLDFKPTNTKLHASCYDQL